MIAQLLIAAAFGACGGGGAVALFAASSTRRLGDKLAEARRIAEDMKGARDVWEAEAHRYSSRCRHYQAAQHGLEQELATAQRAARDATDAAEQWKARHAALVEQLAVLPARDPATGRLRKREYAS